MLRKVNQDPLPLALYLRIRFTWYPTYYYSRNDDPPLAGALLGLRLVLRRLPLQCLSDHQELLQGRHGPGLGGVAPTGGGPPAPPNLLQRGRIQVGVNKDLLEVDGLSILPSIQEQQRGPNPAGKLPEPDVLSGGLVPELQAKGSPGGGGGTRTGRPAPDFFQVW